MDTSAFLAAFFGEGNGISLSDEGHASVLQPWVARARNAPPLATVLPRLQPDGTHQWYAIAWTDRQLRMLREDLLAFVGPTYSSFDGMKTDLDSNDPVEAAIAGLVGDRVFRFEGTQADGLGGQGTQDALELMRSVWRGRHPREEQPAVATGRVLRNLHMALCAGLREEAEGHLRYLQLGQRLDAMNLLFLRVQMLSELGAWHELMQIESIQDLLRVRRPVAVTEALIRAVYRTRLSPYEMAADAKGAAEAFSTSVYPLHGGLYASRAGMRSVEVLKSFMLLAVAAEPGRPELRDEILAIRDLGATDRAYIESVGDLLPRERPSPPAPVALDSVDVATAALAAGDFDCAFKAAVSMRRSVRQAGVLFQCSYQLGTLEAEKAFVAAVNGLPQGDRKGFMAFRLHREHYGALCGKEKGAAGVTTVPLGWSEWLSLVGRADASTVLDWAQRGATEWDPSLLSSPSEVDSFCAKLEACFCSEVGQIVQDALPFVLRYLQRDRSWPNTLLLPAYDQLQTILSLGESVGLSDLEMFLELSTAMFEVGVSDDRYRDVVSNATSLCDRWVTGAWLGWSVDYLDVLTYYPQRDRDAIVAYLSAVSAKFHRFCRHVPTELWPLLRVCLADLDSTDTYEQLARQHPEIESPLETEGSSPWGRLAGMTVALYTLTERVGRRVAQFLLEVCPTAKVHVDHSKVGNAALKKMSRQADLFIVATASAKHAATNCIEQNRPAGLPILRPQGKGSASMIRALLEYLEEAMPDAPSAS